MGRLIKNTATPLGRSKRKLISPTLSPYNSDGDVDHLVTTRPGSSKRKGKIAKLNNNNDQAKRIVSPLSERERLTRALRILDEKDEEENRKSAVQHNLVVVDLESDTEDEEDYDHVVPDKVKIKQPVLSEEEACVDTGDETSDDSEDDMDSFVSANDDCSNGDWMSGESEDESDEQDAPDSEEYSSEAEIDVGFGYQDEGEGEDVHAQDLTEFDYPRYNLVKLWDDYSFVTYDPLSSDPETSSYRQEMDVIPCKNGLWIQTKRSRRMGYGRKLSAKEIRKLDPQISHGYASSKKSHCKCIVCRGEKLSDEKLEEMAMMNRIDGNFFECMKHSEIDEDGAYGAIEVVGYEWN